MPVSWLKMNNSAHKTSHHIKKGLTNQQVSVTKQNVPEKHATKSCTHIHYKIFS